MAMTPWPMAPVSVLEPKCEYGYRTQHACALEETMTARRKNSCIAPRPECGQQRLHLLLFAQIRTTSWACAADRAARPEPQPGLPGPGPGGRGPSRLLGPAFRSQCLRPGLRGPARGPGSGPEARAHARQALSRGWALGFRTPQTVRKSWGGGGSLEKGEPCSHVKHVLTMKTL